MCPIMLMLIMTLPAFAAEHLRHGVHSYQSISSVRRRSAANPLAAIAAVDQWINGYIDPLHILCGQRQ